MDYKEKVIAILNSKELSEEQKEKLEGIFPELAESEDEKIRKHLISLFEKFVTLDVANECETSEIKVDDILAWLEKQGEREPDIIIPKFRIGDTIRIKNSDAEYTITEISNGYYHGKGWCLDVAAGDECGDYELVEQKSADKVEQKFKVGDKVLVDGKVCTIKLVNEDNYIVDENGRDVQEHFSYTKDLKLIRQSSIWNEEDETGLSDTLWAIQQARAIAKDENDMGNLWYAENWIKSIKYRVQPQPKQELREEDKRIIDNLISQLGNLYARKLIKEETKDKYVDWLKSLRPQSQWRPSEEQMDALLFVVQHYTPNVTDKLAWDSIKILELMYYEIKKIKL